MLKSLTMSTIANQGKILLEKIALWKKSYDKSDRILKRKDITLPTKVHLVKGFFFFFFWFFVFVFVFTGVMYGCEGWTIKKSEHRRELML